MDLATALQIAGVLLVAVGAAIVSFPAGLILAGIGALLFGVALERR